MDWKTYAAKETLKPETIENLQEENLDIEKARFVKGVVKASTNLYGVITLFDLFDLVDQFEKDLFTVEDFGAMILTLYLHEQMNFEMHLLNPEAYGLPEDMKVLTITHKNIEKLGKENPKTYDFMMDTLVHLPFYRPANLDELMAYKNPNQIETGEETAELLELASEHQRPEIRVSPRLTVSQLLAALRTWATNADSLKETIDQKYSFPDEVEKDYFMNQLDLSAFEQRLWIYHGLTDDEAQEAAGFAEDDEDPNDIESFELSNEDFERALSTFEQAVHDSSDFTQKEKDELLEEINKTRKQFEELKEKEPED